MISENIRRFCIIIFLCWSAQTVAQFHTYKFQQISTEHGLSSSTVNSIIQDKKGFIWIATEEGLNRYDGYNFKIFKNKVSDSTSLSHNFIWSICEDRNGNIWIATDGGGLNKFDPVKEKFTRYKHNPDDKKSLSSDMLQYVFCDSKNNIWIGTWGGGLNLYNPKENNFTTFRHRTDDSLSLSNNKIFSIYEDSKNNLWICTDGGGASKFNPDKKNFENFMHNPNQNSISFNSVICMMEDSKGNYWFGSYGSGVDKYDPKTGTYINYNTSSDPALSDNSIWNILEDRNGDIWLGTLQSGINILEKNSKKFISLKNNAYDLNSISANHVRTLFEDKSGMLWIGTMAGGLAKIDRKQQKFFHIKKLMDENNTLSEDFIFSIEEDENGDFWYGTYKEGLGRYVKSKDRFIRYNDKSKGITGNLVRTIFKDSDKNIWVGTYFGGLFVYKKESDSFKQISFKNEKGGELLDNIRSIYEDKNKTFWIGTNGGGLIKYDKKRNKFSRYHSNGEEKYKIPTDHIMDIQEDQNGSLWVGTYGYGVLKIDAEGKISNYYNSPEVENCLSDNVITDIYLDNRNRLWIGTYSGGLNLYDEKNDNFITIGEANGIPSSLICAVLEDDENNLWISTSKGITKYNYDKNTIINYDYSDGIQKGEFNPGASVKAKNGWIYFGGVRGITAFDPKRVYENTFEPLVAITSIKILNKEIESDISACYIDTVEIFYGENNITFEFTSLDFTLPGKNNYKYMLEGLDKNWNEVGTRRFATYTHLDDGEYTFKVLGTNNNNLWSTQPATIHLIVNPPFWGTWWFRGIALILLAGTIGFIYQKRISKLEKEKTIHEEFSKRLLISQEEERKRIASELHDSLGQELLIIKNRAILGLKKDDKNFLTEQLKEISSAATLTIEEVRQIAYNLHPYQLDRLGLTKAIKSIISQNEKFGIKFDETIENIDGIFSKESEIQIYRIIQECINNIIKHSNAGAAEIKVHKDAEYIILQIHDNGTGFNINKIEETGKGFGLKNLSKRIQFLKGRIEIVSGQGDGTTIHVKLPI